MLKKFLSSLTIFLLVFSQMSLPSNAKSNIIDSQIVNIDGEKLEMKEIQSEKNDVNIYHFDWEDGTEETLEVKQLEDGQMEAIAIGRNGDKYFMERDLNGDVYVNDELVTETKTELMTETKLISPSQELTSEPGLGEFKHLVTKRTSVSNLVADASLVAGVLALALGWQVGLLTVVASYIASKYIKNVWIQVYHYYAFGSGYEMWLYEKAQFYANPNYVSDLIGVKHKGPYRSVRQ